MGQSASSLWCGTSAEADLAARSAAFGQGESALMSAAEAGNEEKAEWALTKMNASINAMEPKTGETALIVAAANGHVGVMRTLLLHGAAVNLMDDEGRTALHKAARRGHVDAVDLLFRNWANRNLQSKDGFTALHEAAQNGQLEVVQYLVEQAKMDVEVPEATGRSAMHLAYDEEVKLHVLVDRPTQYSSVAVAKSIHFDVAASSYQNTAPAQLADRFHVVRVYLKNARRPETIALLKGAYDGDEEMVMLALRQYASIEAKDERMRTSLALATENGHQGIVKQLLQNGANVNARDNQEYTPLHRAILRDQKEIAEMLLDAHADKETVDADNCLTPLLTAIAVNSPDLCRLLVQKRADIEATVGAHDTVKSVTGALPPLHRAVQEGHLNIVQLLVEAGAHKDRKIPPMQLTPLLIAVNRGLLDIALYLITEGADIHAENSVGWNALRCAVESRNVSMVRMLLDKRVPLREAGQMYRQSNDEVMKEVIFNAAMEIGDLDEIVIEVAKEGRDDKVLRCLGAVPNCAGARDSLGYTALHWAAFEGHVDAADCLLVQGRADVEAVAKFGHRPLLRAVENNKVGSASLLLARGAMVNAADETQHTALHIAARRASLDAIDLLVKHKAALDAVTYDRQTPLHFAAQSGSLPVVKYLVERGSNPNAVTTHHQLPYDLTTSDAIKEFLFSASLRSGEVDPIMLSVAKEGREDKVLYCLKTKPSSIEAVDHFGFTPLLCAAAKGHLGVATLLVEKGADKEATAKYAFRPLSMAIDNGHLSVATMLIKRGANVNGADEIGTTALHIACKRGNYEAVGTLVERGAAIDALTFDKTTPLHRAAAAGSLQIVSYLCDLGADIEARDSHGRRPTDVAGGAQADEIKTYFSRAVIARKWGLHVESEVTGSSAGYEN